MTVIDPPMGVRLRLIHGVLQRIADEHGLDVLHIKGPAVSRELLDTTVQVDPETGEERTIHLPRGSGDADVLVRPEHVYAFLAAVEGCGWRVKTHFDRGSAFAHAVNIYHPGLGNADVHRHFPGLPRDQFDDIWNHRATRELGHTPCNVPSVTAQRLLLLMHAARSGPNHPDIERAWGRATPEQRVAVRELATLLGADLAVAAALGELDEHRDDPDYLLWRHYSQANTSRLGEWRARWRAATTLRQKLVVVRGFVLFDPVSLESDLGRPPTRLEVLRRIRKRFATLVDEVGARVRPGGERR